METDKNIMYNECLVKAMKKILTEYCYEDILKHGETLKSYVPEHKRDDFESWRANRGEAYRRRYKFIMFTINFKEDSDLMVMNRKVIKSIKKKWIKSVIYRWECRDIQEKKDRGGYIGIHVHIRCEIDETKDPYQCKREMYNTFKDVVGSKLHVNARYSNIKDAFIDYCKGYKDGKPKRMYKADEKLKSFMALNK